MTAPPQPSAGKCADDDPELRELAEYQASQTPEDAQAALWAARRQDGLSTDEEAELQDWLAGGTARRARLNQLERLWDRLGELPPDDVAAMKSEVTSCAPAAGLPSAFPRGSDGAPTRQARDSRAPHRPNSDRDTRAHRTPWLQSWRRLVPHATMAGVAAMVAGASWVAWSHWEQQPTFSQRYTTLRGQQLSTTLPEGSTLRLDTATSLNVSLYRHQREVHLPRGQALFEVKPDATRPFHVLAGPMRITVLGTRFSVRYVEEGGDARRVKVVVAEGRVRVTRAALDSRSPVHGPSVLNTTAASEESVELTAGQTVVADAQGNFSPIGTATPASDMAWRNGRVVLSDTPLGQAVAEFERYVDTGLTISDPAVAALRLNGSFDVRQVDVFKNALPQVLPVRLEARANGKTDVSPAH